MSPIMQNFDDYKTLRYPSGQMERELYTLNGKFHRLDGPAGVYYYLSGRIQYHWYYLNGLLHRLDGPAFISYSESGDVLSEDYYLDDEYCYIDPFINRIRCAKNKTKAFIQILNQRTHLKPKIIKIVSNMFKNEVDKNIIDNLNMFF